MDEWRNSRLMFWTGFTPPTLWLLAFFVTPLSLVWAFSFGEKSGILEIEINGTLANYARALEPLYLGIFVKSLWLAALTTVICLMAGLPVALGVAFAPARIRPWLLLLIILPFWTNLLVRTYALMAVLRTNGHVNFILGWLWEHADGFATLIGLGPYQLLGAGFQPLQLMHTTTAVIIGLVYVHLPFMVLPLYAALDRLDRSYIEASLDLGAGHIRTFFAIIAPLAMPGIVSGVILTFIPALGSYLTPDLLGGAGSQMIANVIERQFKSANDWPFGAALSFLLMYATFFALAARALLTPKAGR